MLLNEETQYQGFIKYQGFLSIQIEYDIECEWGLQAEFELGKIEYSGLKVRLSVEVGPTQR